MADDTTVIIDINVEDNSSTDIQHITNNVVHLHQAVQQQQQQNSGWQRSLERVRDRALSGAKAVAKVAASVAAVASVSGPAVSGLLAVGKAVAFVGKAGARLTPLVAFLPSLIGAVALIGTALKVAGPGLARAFEPITRQFVDAKGEATAFAKALQRAVAIDVRPAAEAFAKLNMPAIRHNMDRIAYQTNLIVAGTLRWANSAKGVAAIKSISDATGDAFTKLTPKIIRVVEAFGNLAGKAGGKAITGLGDVIGRILDKISAWAESKDLDDINAALSDLAGYGGRLRDTFAAVRDVGRWMGENQGKVKAFSDAVAAGAIVVGVATGNLPAVVLGAVTLVINHWNQLKAPFAAASGWVSRLVEAWQRDIGRIRIAESIMRALQAGREAFDGIIKDVGPKWAQFVRQLKVAWEEWAPLIKQWWDTSGRAIFIAVGAALATFIVNLITVGTAVAAFVTFVGQAFKTMVATVLGVLGAIIGGAAKAFGWLPGIGPKLVAAAAEFEAFKNNVNRALNGIQRVVTVRVNASVYVTSGGSVSGGVDQRTGNSRDSGLSGVSGWQRVAAEFASAQAGRRTGGPAALTATVSNVINLDGRPFRAYTDHALLESEARQQWRAGNRRDR